MFEHLKEAISQASEWKCEIVCSGYTASDSTHLQDVDICQFIAPVRIPSSTSAGSIGMLLVYNFILHNDDLTDNLLLCKLQMYFPFIYSRMEESFVFQALC